MLRECIRPAKTGCPIWEYNLGYRRGGRGRGACEAASNVGLDNFQRQAKNKAGNRLTVEHDLLTVSAFAMQE